MSKTATRKSKTVLRLAPELIPMIRAGYERFIKLLEICDSQVEQLVPKSKAGDEKASQELRSLFRTILRLQKEIDKYGNLLYPPSTHEELPLQPQEPAKEHIASDNIAALNSSTLTESLSQSSFEKSAFEPAAPKKKFSEEFFKRAPKTKSPAF